MPITPAAIAAGSALAAGAILKATQEEALLSGPEYIRDAQPDGVTRRVGLALARLACQRYGNDPSGLNPDRAVAFENACRPYLDSLGEGTGVGFELPFRGGQCYGVQYRVTTAFNNPPIGFQTNEQIVSARVVGTFRGDRQPNQLTPVGLRLQSQPDGPITNLSIASLGDDDVGSFRIQSVVREGGGTDDCGNPEPEVRQPTGPTIVLPPIVPIIIAPDIDVDARVEVNIDGTIDIDLGTGDITIDPFGGNDDGGSGGDGGPDDSPPAPEPGPDLPGGNGGFGGDDLFGEPPAGRRWVGCCITITARPTNQPPIPNTIPEDVYASVVGNIRLVYNAAGTRQTDTPVRIQARKVCVWEAVRKLNPVGVSVDLQPGFGYRYRPYSVPLDA